MNNKLDVGTVLRSRMSYTTGSTKSGREYHVSIDDIAIVIGDYYLDDYTCVDLLHASEIITWNRDSDTELSRAVRMMYEVIE